MATTVGQHTVATFTSPVNGTTPIDANTVRGNDNTLRTSYNNHDSDTGIHLQSSTYASRPVAGTAGRKWLTISSGRYQIWYDDGTRWHEVASDTVNVDCLSDTALVKGDVVKITGFNNGQNLPTVAKVSSASDVAFGLVEFAVGSSEIVQIVNTGIIEDVDTNGYAVGTILYPDSSGAWTTTKPTSGNYQPAGFVLRGNASNGVLYVEFSSPRIVERSDNTASTVVLRDASGNFAAGTITAGALTSTGLVTFASLKGTGATTVTNILDEDNMASDSATALATQQSIKAYVDSQVGTVDTLAEILANGNTSGGTNLIMSAGDTLTADTIAETTVGAGVTIDSVLLKDDVVNATDIEVGTISANDGVQSAVVASATGVMTIASSVLTTTDINGGTVDGAVIGGASAAAGTFTTLTANTNLTIAGTTTVDGVIDDDTMATASATKLATSESIKAYVDSQVTAQDLDFAGDSGTGAVDLDSQVFTIAGTAGEIETSASGQTITVGLPTNVTIAGDLTVDTNTLFVDATNNRVGIGTASPSTIIDVNGDTPVLTLRDSRVGGTWSAGTALGKLDFYTSDTTGIGPHSIASIGVEAGGQNTASPDGELVFSTGAYNTAASEKMRIDSSGNVGIGTASPKTRLHVQGLSSPSSVPAAGVSPGVSASLYLTNGDPAYGITMGVLNIGDGYIQAQRTADSATTYDLLLNPNGGNVGIGVATPSYKLHVKGSDSVDASIRAEATDANSDAFIVTDNDANGWSFGIDGDNSDAWVLSNAFGLGTPKITVTTGGDVGIGTASPENTFQVAASAVASVPAAGASGHTLAFGSSPYGVAGGALTNGNGYLQVTRWDGTATNYNLLLQPNGGNVGIGTASPAKKLEIASGDIRLGDGYTISWADDGYRIFRNGTQLRFDTNGSQAMTIDSSQNVSITGALSKGSGSFRIEHPLPAKADTHNLVHSFIEGPRADLIYRGIANLVDGFAEVDLDEAATMTTGTWELLCRDAQVFVQNESGWSLVRGSVSGSTLTINAQDNTSTDTVSWIVVAERKDVHMIDTNWTDDNGRVIVEPLKEIKA